MQESKKQKISRRKFLGRSAGFGAGAVFLPTIVPASALGRDGLTAPSNRIAMGFIGTGGMGRGVMGNFQTHPDVQVLAVCDPQPEPRELARAQANLEPGAAYLDFRELIARGDLDAVSIASPDHWHILHSIAAARAGLDLYCQKPLSNTIAEGRALVDAVERHGVVFQHGTQLRSLAKVRHACELVRNGRIGKLHTVTIGSPPGATLPLQPKMPIPPGLDYDLWLGPAPLAPYTPLRIENRGASTGWYFISDYSKAGWIAGYGVHDIDIAHWGMDCERTGPVEIEGEGVFPEDGLFDTVLTYRLEFTYANGVKIVMTDTGQNRHGVKFEGTEGWVYTRSDIDANPKSLLDEKIGADEIHLYESSFHEYNFLECVKSRAQTITPAEVAHRSTSTTLLGGIAVKLKRKLRWDPEREEFVGDAEANRLLSYTMRSPWRL